MNLIAREVDRMVMDEIWGDAERHGSGDVGSVKSNRSPSKGYGTIDRTFSLDCRSGTAHSALYAHGSPARMREVILANTLPPPITCPDWVLAGARLGGKAPCVLAGYPVVFPQTMAFCFGISLCPSGATDGRQTRHSPGPAAGRTMAID